MERTSGALAESEAARQAAEERVADLEAQVADLEAQSGQQADGARPDLAALIAANEPSRFVDEMDADFASLDLSHVALLGVAEDGMRNFLAELGFPSSLMSRIKDTRASDGAQTAVGDHATAYWTTDGFGLNIVIELGT